MEYPMGEVVRYRQRPAELIRNKNPYMPSEKVRKQFRLPAGVPIQQLASVAATIDLAELGIVIPRCKYPERFEAGLRYGLAHNRRTDAKTQFRELFSTGFCWAKMFYKKFAPNHPLAASGSYQMKLTQHGSFEKLKDV